MMGIAPAEYRQKKEYHQASGRLQALPEPVKDGAMTAA
jgi:hypothetical protein